MTDEFGDLRARIARHDPARHLDAAARLQAVSAEEIRERTMRTIEDTITPVSPPRPSRRLAFALGGVAVAIGAAVAVGVAASGDSVSVGEDKAATTLALTAPAGDSTVIGSCMAFDVNVLRGMPVAFGGTVTKVEAGTVTLDVDRWYTGGDAGTVTIANPDAGNVSIDGVEFTAGTRYLVTATDGAVNSCGFTGPATPDLERAFDQAFS